MADQPADFAIYYEEAHPRVLRSIALVLGDAQQAARIAHESLVRTHSAWRRVSASDPFLHTMRCAFRLAWRVRPDDPGVIALPEHGVALEPGDLVAEPELELAIAALPRSLRCVVVFSSYLRLDDRAIATIMGLSPEEVAANRDRATGQLLALLGGDPARVF